MKFIKEWWWLSLFLLIPVLFVLGLDYQSKRQDNAYQESRLFRICIAGHEDDIEHRRVCGRQVEALVSGYKDFEAYGVTLTYDHEARMYIKKEK